MSMFLNRQKKPVKNGRNPHNLHVTHIGRNRDNVISLLIH